MVERATGATDEVTIGIVGKYVGLPDAYLSVAEALRHAAAGQGLLQLRGGFVQIALRKCDGSMGHARQRFQIGPLASHRLRNRTVGQLERFLDAPLADIAGHALHLRFDGALDRAWAGSFDGALEPIKESMAVRPIAALARCGIDPFQCNTRSQKKEPGCRAPKGDLAQAERYGCSISAMNGPPPKAEKRFRAGADSIN